MEHVLVGVEKLQPCTSPAVVDQALCSDRAEDFTLGQPIGYGASSVVHSARFKPAGSDDEPIECALKVIDLDILPPHALPLLRRETQLMALSKHPNVLRGTLAGC